MPELPQKIGLVHREAIRQHPRLRRADAGVAQHEAVSAGIGTLPGAKSLPQGLLDVGAARRLRTKAEHLLEQRERLALCDHAWPLSELGSAPDSAEARRTSSGSTIVSASTGTSSASRDASEPTCFWPTSRRRRGS